MTACEICIKFIVRETLKEAQKMNITYPELCDVTRTYYIELVDENQLEVLEFETEKEALMCYKTLKQLDNTRDIN